MNIDDNIKLEIDAFTDEEVEALDGNEKFHCSNLTDVELQTKTDERCYYIELKDEYFNKTTTIYVDKHDYLLYKRPIWREWKKFQLEKRCLIRAKNGIDYKRCMDDCSKCEKSKNGEPLLLDNLTKEDMKKLKTENNIYRNIAEKLLWNKVKELTTLEQFEKIRLYFKENKTYAQIGEVFGVSHKAIEKTIKNIISKLKASLTKEDLDFIRANLKK